MELVSLVRQMLDTLGPLAREQGVAIDVVDDGAGFDQRRIPTERLGLRVSIKERVAQAGGVVTIDSAAIRLATRLPNMAFWCEAEPPKRLPLRGRAGMWFS